jgi:hypothetical protein
MWHAVDVAAGPIALADGFKSSKNTCTVGVSSRMRFLLTVSCEL